MSVSPAPASVELPRAPRGVLTPTSYFRCVALHATMCVRVCLARQAVAGSRMQRNTSNPWRGRASVFPTCAACPQGEGIRLALGVRLAGWRGTGAGGWCLPPRAPGDREAQLIARARLERTGLLDVPPCLDEPPREWDEG